MAGVPPDDDLLKFEEEITPAVGDDRAVWRILVVDDEPHVHQATRLALKDLSIEGRPLECIHALSAAEARACLLAQPDLAVVLLDVVMESDDAGLALVRFIREDLANQAIRIILRTGQPGYAPEIDTIRVYDINDYKMKSELTQVRLFTSLAVAIRAYRQIHQLEAHRRGLAAIVTAIADLSRTSGLQRFAEGLLTHVCALLGDCADGLVCMATETTNATPSILTAVGRYTGWIGQPLTRVADGSVGPVLKQALTDRRHALGATTCLYLGIPGDLALAVCVDVGHPLSDLDHRLVEIFHANMTVVLENTRLLQRISELAFEDPLLKLDNRNRFLARIDQRPATSNRLAMVDIDGFADINSILDQNFGDAVLQAVAQRLRQVFGPSAQVARIGSDVFGLLGPEARVNEHQIDAVFARPFEVGGETLRLSATSGLVRLDDTSLKGVELLKNAGVALKQAKQLNRGQALYFETAHATAARERMQMLSRLRLAFSAEHLFLVYQPFVDLSSGRIVGAEALLRWRMDNGELVPPDTFIPIAEQSGLMVQIGDWMTRNAFQFLKDLLDLGYRDFRMAINVSHAQFREPDYVEKLVKAIHDQGVDPANVEIELTESVAIDNIALIEQKLAAVRSAGVAIAIDDFGTGYSSLNILRQLHLDRLKIDRTFVGGPQGMDADDGIARMVLQLADQLGLKTIAEGIETQAQREALLRMGCQDGQGYLFSKPLTRDQFEVFIQNR